MTEKSTDADYLAGLMKETFAKQYAATAMATAAHAHEAVKAWLLASPDPDPAYELRAMIAAIPTVDLEPLRMALLDLRETMTIDEVLQLVRRELAELDQL